MAKWIVETKATVRRLYYVEAENEKDANIKSWDASPEHEEDVDEESTSITLDEGTRKR